MHGGAEQQRSVVIDETTKKSISQCIELAPLHNPANLLGIELLQARLPNHIKHVAGFDTAFHATIPEQNYLYALPYQYYRRHRIRRYGFHGTSHRYLAYRYRSIANQEQSKTNIITAHLGNGCSLCQIIGGKSYHTTMGMTPTEGLVMGTRSGSIDPGLLEYIVEKEGIGLQGLDNVLNKMSGLLGVSGITNGHARTTRPRKRKTVIVVLIWQLQCFVAVFKGI